MRELGKWKNRMVRLAALAAVIMMMAGMMPARTLAANELKGSYESPIFGFTVEWDDSVWTGEAIPYDGEVTEGLSINSEISWGNIRASAWPDIDQEACLEYMVEKFDGDKAMKNFRRAPRSMDLPVSELGGQQGLYTVSLASENDDVPMVFYLECVSIGDDQAALMVMLAAPASAYESALPEWEVLIAGIVPGDGPIEVADSASSPSTDDANYSNPDLGFSVTWDESVWTGTEIDDEIMPGVDLESELSSGYIVAKEYSDLTPSECVDTVASTMEETDEYKRVRKAPSEMDRLKTDPAASGELYTLLATDSPTKIAVYAECRLLPDPDHMLVVTLITIASDYDAEFPAWQEMIDGVAVDDQASSSGRDDSGADPISNDGATFTGVNYDFAVSYDDTLWTPEESTDKGYDWLGLTSDYGQAVIIGTSTDIDLQGCIDTLVENEQQYADGPIEVAPRSYERPQTSRDAEGELYTYQATTDTEPVDTLVYFDCRAIDEGESVVGFTFVTTPDLYEDALPEVEALLDSIQIG